MRFWAVASFFKLVVNWKLGETKLPKCPILPVIGAERTNNRFRYLCDTEPVREGTSFQEQRFDSGNLRCERHIEFKPREIISIDDDRADRPANSDVGKNNMNYRGCGRGS